MTDPRNLFPSQYEAVERAMQPEAGIVSPVGEESVAIITRLTPVEDSQEYVGNILRRTCQAAGEVSCQAVCVRRGTPEYDANLDQLCADRNLAQGLEKIGIDPRDVLMVAVTGDEVGFGDQLDEYREEGRIKDNPEGWRELPGFNAFFARPSEVPAIGSRLADCAHLEFEFQDSDGQTVIGFEHGTKPNMTGRGAFKFAADGYPASYTRRVLTEAMQHYGADPRTLKIRLSSSIRGENFVKHYDNRDAMEKDLPGWYYDGFLANASDPSWFPGQPLSEVHKEDAWHADARGLILRDIDQAMLVLGVPPENFVHDAMLDPADSNGEFSSHQNSATYGDTRDLYLIAHRSAFKEW